MLNCIAVAIAVAVAILATLYGKNLLWPNTPLTYSPNGEGEWCEACLQNRVCLILLPQHSLGCVATLLKGANHR